MLRLSLYALAVGLLMVLVAIPTGIADWWGIRKDRPAWKLGVFHMAVNWTASLAFGVSLGIRLAGGAAGGVGGLPLALSVVGAAFLLVGLYLGGRMIYDYGISVARYSKAQWRELALAGKARVPTKRE